MKRYKSILLESNIPTTIQIGKKYPSIDGNGTVEVTSIYIDSFHMNHPETYIEFNWYNEETGKKGCSNTKSFFF